MRRATAALIVATGMVLAAATAAAGQDEAARRPAATRKDGPWFGVMLPPRADAAPAVKVGARPPRPIAADTSTPEFNGATIKADVDAIVGFSKRARASKEIGNGQMWGRISGFPSSDQTVEWAVDQFKKAGITDVKTQPISQDEKSSLWLPLSWRVTVLADPAFGAGSADVVLESALPVSPSAVSGGTMTAPLVYVGAASPAVLQHIDVKGKIAVQLIVPQGHMLFERGAVDSRAEELVKRGAVGVFNLVRLPGNELSRDFSDCGNPCFNIGGRDGLFLESILDRAAQAGAHDTVRARIDLQTQTYRGLKATNGVAVIRGTLDEVIVLNAHVDGWFDGAGDNGDGLGVLVALARHFAKPANKPQRTIAFVASAGHHTPGINGPRSFLAANPELAKKAVMLVNIEHVAQRNFSPARTTSADGYREAVADSGEAPIAVGVTNNSPFLQELIDGGPARFGVNFISERSTFQSGETGGWASLNVAKVSVMQAPPLYHTTGEVLDVISAPGLERIARFLASFVASVDRAPRERITP
ncbi:MAG TPA: M28 family peptidase [Vicinamibacterales bacterium]